MILTEEFYDDMFEKLKDVTHWDSHIEKYVRILGINSVWLLPNLGSLLLFMGLYPLMVITFVLLTLLNKFFPSLTEKRISFSGIVFWNWPIGFLNDSFIVIVISCLINIKYSSWEVKEAAINSGISWALLALACIYPAYMQTFLYKRRNRL